MAATACLIVLICACAVVPANCVLNLAADTDCGHSKAPLIRIKNGDAATPGEFPWNGAIFLANTWRNSSHYTCGGAVIHKRFILTAAHCINDTEAQRVTVTLGQHSFAQETENEQKVAVKRLIPHQHYSIEGMQVYNDIALLELGEDLVWTQFVQPVCLPESEDDDPLVGQKVTVAGWGMLDESDNGGLAPSVLQKVKLKVLASTDCAEWYRTSLDVPYEMTDTHLCAGFKEGHKDACKGDSGGPLVFQHDDERRVAIGVVSAGFGCGRPMLPGIYTRVSKFIDWITETIKLSGFYINVQQLES